MKTTHWKPPCGKKIDFTPAKHCTTIDTMETTADGYDESLFGFAVIDDKGKQIETWYSLIYGPTMINIKEDKKASVWPPR
jgi:hypothetical protein